MIGDFARWSRLVDEALPPPLRLTLVDPALLGHGDALPCLERSAAGASRWVVLLKHFRCCNQSLDVPDVVVSIVGVVARDVFCTLLTAGRVLKNDGLLQSS